MPDSPVRQKSELQLLRERNIREREAYFNAFMVTDPEFAEALTAINSYNVEREKQTKSKSTRRRKGDSAFVFKGLIPTEKRKSARLENKTPQYNYMDLVDVDEKVFKRKRNISDDEDFENLEKIVYKPKKARSSNRHSGRPPIIAVEDVTEEMIKDISYRVADKVYSDKGSSCHQCRQKTLDQKSCCRNENCIGVRGQFCGVCMLNRYGEDAKIALKDPNWHCFVCRGICNCSFCRAKAGKRPTGILAPIAHSTGFKSVKDFLDSLKGEGDFAEEDNKWKAFKNPKNVVGFSADGLTVRMGNNVECNLFELSKCSCVKRIMENREREKFENPENLLGFSKCHSMAIMATNISEDLFADSSCRCSLVQQ